MIMIAWLSLESYYPWSYQSIINHIMHHGCPVAHLYPFIKTYIFLKVIQHAKWVAQTGFETVKSEVLGKLAGMGTGAGQALAESNMALWEWFCSPMVDISGVSLQHFIADPSPSNFPKSHR